MSFLAANAAHTVSPLIAQAAPWLILIVLLASLGSLLKLFKPFIKGFVGEQAVHRCSLSNLGEGYTAYKDLYVPRPDGNGTTQVDHVVVSVYGVVVIETKNYSGWIFGSERSAKWTQCLKGGLKNSFQNPLFQNKLHVRALSVALDLPLSCFHSIVYFVGSCTFKTLLPENVIQSGLSSYIRNQDTPVFTREEVFEICRYLDALKANRSELKAKHHVRRTQRS